MGRTETEQNPLPAILLIATLLVVVCLLISIWQTSTVKAGSPVDAEAALADGMANALGNLVMLVVGVAVVVTALGMIRGRSLAIRSQQQMAELNQYFASKRAELDAAARAADAAFAPPRQPILIQPPPARKRVLH
jgi:C4-dicarboxylate transporter